MSARRSGRAKAPVKYTSDSEDSDFGNKKPRKTTTKAVPKKRTKADDEPAADGPASPKKRTKKDPETAAAKESAKSNKAAEKQSKKAWEDWLEAHDVEGELLDEEPAREESITQTDSLKKYGLKKEDLGSLKHFEKKNPLYNNTIKLFLEEEVKTLGFRKAGMLSGEAQDEDDEQIIKRGEKIWTEEHKDDPKEEPKSDKKKAPKAKTPKQKWTAYVEAHTVSAPDALKEEPEDAINQSDCKPKYSLLPADLAVLPYFPKPNPKYGNTTKLFKESEVKTLAYRKAAVLGDVDEADEELLEKRKALLEKD